jgi:hypothetical protein
LRVRDHTAAPFRNSVPYCTTAKPVAERRKKGKNNECIHAQDANQIWPNKPGFLPPMRFSGTTTSDRKLVSQKENQNSAFKLGYKEAIELD